MKYTPTFSFLGCLFLASLNLQAQQNTIANIKATVEQPEVETHIRLLASDELAGRDVGSPGLDIAARYLASTFRSWGLKPLPELNGYMQEVPFLESTPPSQGQLKLGDQSFSLNEGFLVREGKDGNVQGQAVVLDYGIDAELRQLN